MTMVPLERIRWVDRTEWGAERDALLRSCTKREGVGEAYGPYGNFIVVCFEKAQLGRSK